MRQIAHRLAAKLVEAGQRRPLLAQAGQHVLEHPRQLADLVAALDRQRRLVRAGLHPLARDRRDRVRPTRQRAAIDAASQTASAVVSATMAAMATSAGTP